MVSTVTKNKKENSNSNNNFSLRKRAFALLQRLGKSLLFPIAMLPIAAIFFRLGAAIPGDTEFSAFIAGLFSTIGSAVFGTALPFLFAIGIAFGMTKDQRGEAAIVGFSVMVLLTVLLSSNSNNFKEVIDQAKDGGVKIAPSATSVNFGGFDFVHKIYHGISLEGGKGFHGIFGTAYNSILAGNVFTGIFGGSVVAYIYNRFNGIEMPSVLGFFSGRRLVPVLSILIVTVLGLIWALIFPWFGVGLHYVGKGMGEAQGNRWSNAGIMAVYGFVNRLLIPFGLHHTINIPLWFTEVGGTHTNGTGTAAKVIAGDINIFTKGSASGNHAGTFQAGFFPVMMFGLPALAFAFYYNAKNDVQKARVASLFAGSSLVAFFTGITEPVEFAFMFLAPALYGFHAVLSAVSGFIVGIFGIQLGFGFSAGLIDYVLSIPKSMDIIHANKSGFNAVMANPGWIWPIGIATGAMYFFGANFLIKKFNFSTPGRGTALIDQDTDDVSNVSSGVSGSNKYTNDSLTIIKSVGGYENITSLGNCATRLRFELKDSSKVNSSAIKKTKAIGQMKVAGGYQIIMGPTVEMYADEIQKHMKNKTTLGKQNINEVSKVKKQNKAVSVSKNIDVKSVANGTVASLASLKDGVFSKKMMGDGIVVKFPTAAKKGEVFAPVSGELVTVFPTGHAYGIKTEEGIEVLVHIGVDTVKLGGKGFKAFVKQGAKVKAGAKMAEVDLTYVRKAAPSANPIVLVTSGETVIAKATGKITKTSKLFTIK